MTASMTGFGTATCADGTRRVTAEARSVNHRFIKTQVKCARPVQAFEADIEARTRARFARGAINVSVTVSDPGLEAGLGIDGARIAAQRDRVALLFRDLFPGAPAIEPARLFELLLRLPGAIAGDDGESPEAQAALGALVAHAVGGALDSLAESRAAEGAKLAVILRAHRDTVARIVAAIAARAPDIARENRDRFRARVSALITDVRPGVALDEDIVLREAAAFAERIDVTEELGRLQSHCTRFDQIMAEDREVGRRLDFLTQEMLREANTIGSKASDLAVAHQVVELKAEIDRMKEQVANLE